MKEPDIQYSKLRRHRKALDLPGHAHELTFSCYRRYPLLSRDRTRLWFCDSLSGAAKKWDFAIFAWVIMPEHVHVVLRPRRPDYRMAHILRAIKLPVSRRAMRYLTDRDSPWLDRLTRIRGSRTERLFWQSGGGYDRNIDSSETLARSIEYIHSNPVRRGLVESASDWYWSSAADYYRMRKAPVPIEMPQSQ